jgi:hypothetical protein
MLKPTVITSQPNAKSFKCIDPTGRKLLCILVVTKVKPPQSNKTENSISHFVLPLASSFLYDAHHKKTPFHPLSELPTSSTIFATDIIL